MNPAVKFASEAAMRRGYKPYIVEWGLRGMIEGWIHEVTPEILSGILHKGGTILGSSRSKRFFQLEHRKTALENLQQHGIDHLIVIGGDGSFGALNQFYSDFGLPFAGIPATIDNDIPGTDYCLGVDTALNMIRQSIDCIRDTASSFSRAFVIETMGRDCGYLAMTSALATGAEICLVPEIAYDLDAIAERLRKEREAGRNYLLGIVAEGVGMGDSLTRWMSDALGMDARLTVLGHVQRGGSPSVHDRVMAHKFAEAAMDSLVAGNTNKIITYKAGEFSTEPINVVTDTKYQVDPSLIRHCESLSR